MNSELDMLFLRNLRFNLANVAYLKNAVSEGISNNSIMCKRHARWLKQTLDSSGARTISHTDLHLLNDNSMKYSSRLYTKSSTLCQHSKTTSVEPNNKSGILQRMFGKLKYQKEAYRNSGFLLYEKCTDGVSFEHFMNRCKMPDTYYSWFLITELHVWMCMVRAMEEGAEGKVVRNGIVEALWQDANIRARKAGASAASQRRADMLELNEQFIAALFLYDEGLQSSDKVLAGALWYRLLGRNCDDAEVLANVVRYVRQQTLGLEKFSRDDILLHGNVKFSPLT